MNINLMFKDKSCLTLKNVVGNLNEDGFAYCSVNIQTIVDNISLEAIANVEHLNLTNLNNKIFKIQSVVIDLYEDFLKNDTEVLKYNVEIPFEFKLLKVLYFKNCLNPNMLTIDIPIVLKLSQRNIDSYTFYYNNLNNYLDVHVDFSTYHIYNNILESSKLIRQYFDYSINSPNKFKISSLLKAIRNYFPQKQDIEILFSLDVFLKADYLENKLSSYVSQNDYLEHNFIVSDNISNYLICGISKYKDRLLFENDITFFNKNTELIDSLFNNLLDRSYISDNIKDTISINKNSIKDKIYNSKYIYNSSKKCEYIENVKNKSTNFELKSTYELFESICKYEQEYGLDVSGFNKSQYLELYDSFETNKIDINTKILSKYISFCDNARALLDFQNSYKEKYNLEINSKREKSYYDSQKDMSKAIEYMITTGFKNKQLIDIEHLIFLTFAPKFLSTESDEITIDNYIDILNNIYKFSFNGKDYCLDYLYNISIQLVENFINNYRTNSDNKLFNRNMYSRKYKETLNKYYDLLNNSNTLSYKISDKMKSMRNILTQINYFKLEILAKEYDKSFLIQNLNTIVKSRIDNKVRRQNSKYVYYSNFEKWLQSI